MHMLVTYIYTLCTMPMSAQAENSRLCSYLSSLGYDGSLFTWTVVCLTVANFKHLLLSVPGFALSNIANIYIFIAYFPWYDTDHIENDVSNNSSIVPCAFVTAVTFLLSQCLATIGEYLPSRCIATIRGYTHTDWWEGLMRYAVEMGSGAVIYVPSFI
jgi:hypothetical protein